MRSVLLSIMALPVSCALAQFQGDWDWHQPPSNAVPTVRIISPHEDAIFLEDQKIQICADADYFTNPIARVEFFAGTNSLGVRTNNPSPWGRLRDTFCLTVTNLTAGDYTLAAVATDTAGNSATSAGVDISVATNLPPKVRLIKPRDGAVILGPTNITICAAAYDPDGTVVSVEFFAGTHSLGVVPTPPPVFVTNSWGVFPIMTPYCLTWSNVAAGTYSLTAVATDNDGATTVSAAVGISVVTNLPPRVHIETPYNGATFTAPANIRISAAASDPDGTVTGVEFFAGTNSLGAVTTPVLVTNYGHVTSVYSLNWSAVPAGQYVLTAVATDNGGAETTSAPVNVRVVPPPPPAVKIIYPFNGTTFYNAPRNIKITAIESNFTQPVVSVQFFANATSLGMTTNSPYSSIVWSNAPAGSYTLTAVATGSGGLSVTSAPAVNINVTTNRPPPWP